MTERLRALVFRIPSGFEARCVDASGVGFGDSAKEALEDLAIALAMNYKVSAEEGLSFRREPTAEEQETCERIMKREPVAREVVQLAYIAELTGKSTDTQRFGLTAS